MPQFPSREELWRLAAGPRFRWLVLAGALAGVGLRLWLAAGHYGNYDQTSFHDVAGIMSRGENLYAETDRYNDSPVWAHVLWGLSRITQVTGFPFHFVIRGFLTLVDLVNAAFIGLIGARVLGCPPALGFLAYLLNPVSILIVGYHGQFDNLASLPLLIAVWLLIRGRPTHPAVIWSLGPRGC